MVKNIGFPRKVEGSLGRLVIPAEFREALEIGDNDYVELFLNNKEITVRKLNPFCIFCGSEANLAEYENKKICPDCAKKIMKKFDGQN